jgi:hypothetical protein
MPMGYFITDDFSAAKIDKIHETEGFWEQGIVKTHNYASLPHHLIPFRGVRLAPLRYAARRPSSPFAFSLFQLRKTVPDSLSVN